MIYKHIWGFGGCRLVIPSLGAEYDVELERASGSLSFTPVGTNYTTINQKTVSRGWGWRAVIAIEAVNSCAGDYAYHQKLINVLNAGHYLNYAIRVYPNYLSADDNLYYDCRLVSDVGWVSVAPVKAAQRITLSFESIEILTLLPTLTSDPDSYDWVEGTAGVDGDYIYYGTTSTPDDKIIFHPE